MSKSTVSVVTAQTVRSFLSVEARLAKLSPEAQRTVVGTEGKAPRGRLHKEAIKAYNRGRKADRQYVLGAGAVVKAQAATVRAAHVAAGGGKRGPLPKPAAPAKVAKGKASTPKA